MAINKKGILDKISVPNLILRLIIIFMLAWFIIFLIVPITIIFSNVFQNSQGEYVGLSNFSKYFTTPALKIAIFNSISISTMTTIISVFLAFLFAYGMTRSAIKIKPAYRYIAMLPLFVPTMVHGLSLTYLFGRKGIFTTLGLDFPVSGERGIIIAEIIYTFPQAYMILMVALENADFRLYEAASTLGAGPIKTFFGVTLPSIKYGLISAITLCFTLSFTDFGAPQAIGANFPVLSTSIYKYVVGQHNFQMGAVIGVLLTIPAVIAFVVDRITQKRSGNSEISSKAVAYKITKSRFKDLFYQGYCSLISLSILTMFGAVSVIAFIKRWPYEKVFTLKHFDFGSRLLGSGLATFQFSIKMSALTAVFGTLMAFLVAYIVVKVQVLSPIRKFIHFFSMIPMALPGMVIGLAYIMFFNKPYFNIDFLNIRVSNSFTVLYQTVAIMVIANIIHMFSVTYVTATTALKKLDKEYENVADSMNIPFYRVIFHVTIPMSITAILEIAVYFFVNSMVTVSALVFLYSPQSKPAALSIVSMEDNGDFESAAAMSLIILSCNIVIRVLYEIALKTVMKRINKWKTGEIEKTKKEKLLVAI